MLRLSLQREKNPSSSSDSEDEQPKKITAVPTNFTVRKRTAAQELFVVDTKPIQEESPKDIIIEELETNNPAEVPVDKKLQQVLSKAQCGPAFEKNPGATGRLMGTKALKRKRKEEREKTAGKDWFNMPATELTEENRQDLELLQMRNAIDPTRHYRRSDRTVLPKYFQVGRVVDAPEDYYSGRMTKKERKNTMVDELLNDMDFINRSKAKYREIQAAEAKKKRGAFQRRGGPQRKKDKREKPGKKKRQ